MATAQQEQPGRVQIDGAIGPNAARINGRYSLVVEKYHGSPMWKKDSAGDIWLLKFREFNTFTVTTTIHKESNDRVGYAHSESGGKGLPFEVSSSWHVWTGNAWEIQHLVVQACMGTLAADFEFMLREGIGTDVALYVGTEKKIIHAHRLVLSARSPVFRQMLLSSGMSEATADGEVVLTDVNSQVMDWFLHYLYTDSLAPELDGNDEALCHILAVAHKYQVDSLVNRCIMGIVSNLTEDTACERLMMADLLGLADFQQLVLQYICSTPERIVNIQVTEGYSRLKDQRPRLLADILAQAVTPRKRPSSLPENLNTRTMASLRVLLSDRGLPVRGSREVLLTRLREAPNL